MNRLIAYLRLPLSALRIWMDIRDADYDASDKRRIFRILWSMRVKEIGASADTIVSHEIFGFTVHAYDYPNLRFLFKEIFLAKSYSFSSDRPDPRVVDCGANIGMAVLYIKHIYPRARITAFEPNPSAFALLKRNVEVNKLTDVVVINKAVSNSDAPISFFVSEDKGTLLASVRQDRGGAKEIRVDTVRLSDWLEEETDFVKIDVEGAEWLILDDLKQHPTGLAKVRELIVEYHHRITGERSRLAAFLAFFEERGYEYNLLAEYRYRGDFQDVVVHFYR
jgi:FkbM family methyltransferase